MNKLTNDQITDIWEAMPGQPGAWLKQFGYIQFARAIEDAVSTAVGEPVATDDLPTLPEPYGGMLRLAGGIEPVYTADQMREYARAAIAARLAAPTQASAPQAAKPSTKVTLAVIGRKHFGNPIPAEWYAAAHDLLADIGAPQASAAQEVRAVPDDVHRALDRMCTPLDESRLSGATAAEDARCMQIIRRYVEGTSTAPAAMDEKGGAK